MACFLQNYYKNGFPKSNVLTFVDHSNRFTMIDECDLGGACFRCWYVFGRSSLAVYFTLWAREYRLGCTCSRFGSTMNRDFVCCWKNYNLLMFLHKFMPEQSNQNWLKVKECMQSALPTPHRPLPWTRVCIRLSRICLSNMQCTLK